MRLPLPPGPALAPEEQTFLWFSKTYAFLDRCAGEFGDTFTLEFKGLGTHVFFSHPSAIHDIFNGDPGIFRAGEGNAFIRPFLRDHSLLTMDGAPYARHRKMILPAFQPQKVSGHAALMREIASEAISHWKTNEAFSALAALLPLTLDVILRAIFGPPSERLAEMRRLLVPLLDAASFTPLASGDTATAGSPQRAWEKFQSSLKALDALFAEELAAQRKAPAPGTLVAMLIAARDDEGRGLSDEELRDEIVTLVLAGHETTATSLAWALYWVLGDTRVERKLKEEVRAASDNVAEWLALPYLDAVVKETLRINPVIPFVSWRLAGDATVAGIELPSGVHVVPCIYLTHRRSSLYPEPESFRPERFLERKFTPYEYYPFGGGVRRCIGMGFGLTEMKVVLAEILRRLEMRVESDGKMHPVRRSVVVAPAGGARVVVYSKNSP